MGIDERFKKLSDYIEGLGGSTQANHYGVFEQRYHVRDQELGDLKLRDQFMHQLEPFKSHHDNYIETIKALPSETALMGTQWLQSIVDTVTADGDCLIVPSQ